MKNKRMCKMRPCGFCASYLSVFSVIEERLIICALVSFIDSIEDDYRRRSFEGTQNLYSWFTETYGVSPLFLRLFYPSDESYRNDGGSSFPQKDSAGNLISLGIYLILVSCIVAFNTNLSFSLCSR